MIAFLRQLRLSDVRTRRCLTTEDAKNAAGRLFAGRCLKRTTAAVRIAELAIAREAVEHPAGFGQLFPPHRYRHPLIASAEGDL